MLARSKNMVRETRRALLGTAPDGLTRIDLLQIRAMFAQTLEIFEDTVSAIGELNMGSQTLEPSTDEFLDSLCPNGLLAREVIVSIVEGRKVTRNEVRDVLIESGDTIEGFKAKLRNARELCAAVETIKNADAETERISALRIAKENAIKAVEDEIKRHVAEMDRLTRERSIAQDDYLQAAQPITDSLSDARHLISSRQSDEAKAEFNVLSNTAVTLGNHLVKLRDEASRLAHRVNRLDTDGKGDELKPLPEMKERLATLQGELETVTFDHEAAKTALEKLERETTSDWRLMNFD